MWTWLGPAKKRPWPTGKLARRFLFFFGELEDIGKDIHGGAGLFEQELHGRVGDNGAAHFAAHEILNVLGDGSETKVVFAGALGERLKRKLAESSYFMSCQASSTMRRRRFCWARTTFQMWERIIYIATGAKFVLEVADVENDHRVVDVDVGLLGEDTSEGAGGVFAEALGELGTGATHME